MNPYEYGRAFFPHLSPGCSLALVLRLLELWREGKFGQPQTKGNK